MQAAAFAVPLMPANGRAAVAAADIKQTIWWEPSYGGYCPPANGCYGYYGYYPRHYGYHRPYYGFYQPYRRYWWGRSRQWSWW